MAQGQEVGPYDPLGIRAGAFRIYPSLTVSEEYNDNVFAVDNNTDDDLITNIAPTLRAESNFSRHRLGFAAGADVGIYLNEEDEDYQDFFVSTDGRLDITRQNFFDGLLRVRARSRRPRRSGGRERSRRDQDIQPIWQ